jgi:hypothetical protein
MRKYNLAFLFLFFVQFLFSQFECGTDIVHSNLYNSDPVYRSNFDLAQTRINSANMHKFLENGVYYLPVVVHIMHTGEPIGGVFNPSDQKIADFLTSLNKVFFAKYTGYPDTSNGGQYINIQFRLVQRDSNCKPLKGINRIDLQDDITYVNNGLMVDNNGSGLKDIELAKKSFYDNRRFINLYLVTKTSSSSVLGFAYYPNSSYSLGDGIYITSNDVYTGSMETIVHEMGHFFGLNHTFEGSGAGCPSNTNCATDGDKICDTDPVLKQFTCSKTDNNTCTNKPMGNLAINFMSYCNKTSIFTPMQKTRIISSLLNVRSGLVNATNSEKPTNLKPDNKLTTDSIVCSNYSDNELAWYEKTTGAISGETKKVLKLTKTGYYFSIAKIYGCNSVSSDTIYFKKANASIELNPANPFTIYKSDKSLFTINSEIAPSNIMIYDINGKKILNLMNEKTIDLTAFSIGIYFIKIELNKTVYHSKIMND